MVAGVLRRDLALPSALRTLPLRSRDPAFEVVLLAALLGRREAPSGE